MLHWRLGWKKRTENGDNIGCLSSSYYLYPALLLPRGLCLLSTSCDSNFLPLSQLRGHRLRSPVLRIRKYSKMELLKMDEPDLRLSSRPVAVRVLWNVVKRRWWEFWISRVSAITAKWWWEGVQQVGGSHREACEFVGQGAPWLQKRLHAAFSFSHPSIFGAGVMQPAVISQSGRSWATSAPGPN